MFVWKTRAKNARENVGEIDTKSEIQADLAIRGRYVPSIDREYWNSE